MLKYYCTKGLKNKMINKNKNAASNQIKTKYIGIVDDQEELLMERCGRCGTLEFKILGWKYKGISELDEAGNIKHFYIKEVDD